MFVLCSLILILSTYQLNLGVRLRRVTEWPAPAGSSILRYVGSHLKHCFVDDKAQWIKSSPCYGNKLWLIGALNIVFSITYYLELCNAVTIYCAYYFWPAKAKLVVWTV